MSDDIAIKVENLSKRYRIGRKEEMHDTMAGALVDFVKRPFSNLRRLRQLSTFSENGGEADDVIWALKDVSFEVERGEVVGIIGRNGAGKSTLLKILARITEPTSGQVGLRGRVSSLLEVGTGFHPELTGRENIYLNGTILGMRKGEIERKFDEIVDFSGVEKFIDTPVKRYSSGMQVRLAFSVAAHLEPEILLVDEVLAVGDLKFQQKCLGKLDDITQTGRTVLFISHQMDQIRRLCGQCMWIDKGQIRHHENVHEVVALYEDAMINGGQIVDENRLMNDQTRFVGWRIVGRQSKEGNVLDHLGAVAIEFDVLVTKAINCGRHGLVLYDRDNHIMWSSAVDGFAMDKGLHKITYEFPSIPLRPGHYHWYMNLYDGSEHLDRWYPSSLLVVATHNNTHPLKRLRGFLNIPWSVKYE